MTAGRRRRDSRTSWQVREGAGGLREGGKRGGEETGGGGERTGGQEEKPSCKCSVDNRPAACHQISLIIRGGADSCWVLPLAYSGCKLAAMNMVRGRCKLRFDVPDASVCKHSNAPTQRQGLSHTIQHFHCHHCCPPPLPQAAAPPWPMVVLVLLLVLLPPSVAPAAPPSGPSAPR